MSKAIRVNIGGKDLTLRGDDEEKIKKALTQAEGTIEDTLKAIKKYVK